MRKSTAAAAAAAPPTCLDSAGATIPPPTAGLALALALADPPSPTIDFLTAAAVSYNFAMCANMPLIYFNLCICKI